MYYPIEMDGGFWCEECQVFVEESHCHGTPSESLRNLSHAAFEAALGWKLMYHICGEPRQFWAWQDEQELAFVFAERARVEEAGVVLLPRRAATLHGYTYYA